MRSDLSAVVNQVEPSANMSDRRDCEPVNTWSNPLQNVSTYAYENAFTDVNFNVTPTTSSIYTDVNVTSTSSDYHAILAQDIIDRYIMKIICGFGLLGNIFNLIILTSQSVMKSMERLEKCANAGLTSLAVSDISSVCCC